MPFVRCNILVSGGGGSSSRQVYATRHSHTLGGIKRAVYASSRYRVCIVLRSAKHGAHTHPAARKGARLSVQRTVFARRVVPETPHAALYMIPPPPSIPFCSQKTGVVVFFLSQPLNRIVICANIEIGCGPLGLNKEKETNENYRRSTCASSQHMIRSIMILLQSLMYLQCDRRRCEFYKPP